MGTHRAGAATGKGLFELRRAVGGWRIQRISFLGEPVSMLQPPQADGRMLAALRRQRRPGVEAAADRVAGSTRCALG